MISVVATDIIVQIIEQIIDNISKNVNENKNIQVILVSEFNQKMSESQTKAGNQNFFLKF